MSLRLIGSVSPSGDSTKISDTVGVLGGLSLSILKELCDVQNADEKFGILSTSPFGVKTDAELAAYLGMAEVDVTTRRTTLDTLRP